MRNKKTVEGLIALKKHITDNQQLFKDARAGLCWGIIQIHWQDKITEAIARKLHKLIWAEARKRKIQEDDIRHSYLWSRGDMEPRIKWIDKQIKLLKGTK